MPDPDKSFDDGEDLEGKVVLTAEDALAAARLFRLLSDAVSGVPPNVPHDQPDRDELIARARIILHGRRARTRHFKSSMFGEPAWDMLLALFASQKSGARSSPHRLADLAGTPLTTASRWIDYLERDHLVRRVSHPTDKRKIFVELTDKAISMIEQYLREMAWLPAANSP